MRDMQRAPLVFCCPTSQRMWWRVYVAYTRRGFWQVAFLGHQPNIRWVHTAHAEQFVTSFRPPTITGVAGDLKGIAARLGVRVLKSSRLRFVRHEKGNKRSLTAVLDGAQGSFVLARMRVRQDRFKERVVSGALGQLSAYLRLIEEFGYGGVPENEVEEYAMLPVHGSLTGSSLDTPAITTAQALRAAGQ